MITPVAKDNVPSEARVASPLIETLARVVPSLTKIFPEVPAANSAGSPAVPIRIEPLVIS